MLPYRRAYLLAAVVTKVEKIQMIFRCFHLTGHLIAVGLQRGTRRSQGVDDPQVFHFTIISNDGDEVTGVRRPISVHAPPLAVAQGVGVEQAVGDAVAKAFRTVRGQLYLDNGAVLLVLLRLAVIGDAHAIEIAIFGIDHRLSVG